MKRAAILAVAAVVAMAGGQVSATTGGTVASPIDEGAAGAPVMALADAWNRADPTAWGTQFWSDCEFTNILGGVFHGRAENAAQHAHIWAGPYRGSRFAARIVRVWPLGPDHALIDTEAEVRDYKALPPSVMVAEPGVLRTRFRHIVERRSDVWRILFSQNTVVAPAPSAFAPTAGVAPVHATPPAN